jgi:hypothetical protein
MTAGTTTPEAHAAADLRAAWDRLRREAVDYAVGKLDVWQAQAEGARPAPAATDRAVVGGLTALLSGGNPVTAALAAAWHAADAKKRAQIVATVLLLALLAPVALVLLLLALLVTALVLAVSGKPPAPVERLLKRLSATAS